MMPLTPAWGILAPALLGLVLVLRGQRQPLGSAERDRLTCQGFGWLSFAAALITAVAWTT